MDQKTKYRSLLIFGPPGSGKGTQGKLICEAGGHYHLSTGDIFRGLSPESPEGQLFHKYADKGHLVPDEVTVEIWHRYVEGLIDSNRYFPKRQLLLLDGIPRTVKQVELLKDYVDVKKIIVLEAREKEVLIERLVNRGKIEGRKDDVDAFILKTRMEVYERETFKVLQCYPKELIARFNAQQTPVEVFRDILDELSDLLSAQ